MKESCIIGFIHSLKKKRSYLLFLIWFQTKVFTNLRISPFTRITKQLDDGNYGCNIFVDFQKTFEYCWWWHTILGPLLFLVYVNELHCAFKYYKVHHFADDTNLMNFHIFIKLVNKQINHNLKNLSNWLHKTILRLSHLFQVSRAFALFHKSIFKTTLSFLFNTTFKTYPIWPSIAV